MTVKIIVRSTRDKEIAMATVGAINISPEHPMFVEVGGHTSTRSQKQNKLAFKWHKERAEFIGNSVEEERAFCKLTYGVPIMRSEDESFRASYDKAIQPFPYAQRLEIIQDLDIPVTRSMNTKQFANYLENIDRDTIMNLGLALSRPDDLYWEAMGIKRRANV